MDSEPLQLFPNNSYHIIADSAFPCRTHLIPAIKSAYANTVAERNFNYKLSATRMVVEHAFGLLKNRWRILGHIEADVPKAVQIISSCVYLHNFIIFWEPQIQTAATINHTSGSGDIGAIRNMSPISYDY